MRVGILSGFACIWILGGVAIGQSADPNPSGATNLSEAELAPASSTNLQEQQEIIQQAIAQTRREAEAVANRNAEALGRRLTLLQQSIESQHERGLAAVQSSNRNTLVIAAVLTGIGLLGMFYTAILVIRATHRLTETALAVPLTHALAPGQARAALSAGDAPFANPAELAGARFLGALKQLEKRLHELEHSAPPPRLVRANQRRDGHPEFESGKSAANPDEMAIPGETEKAAALVPAESSGAASRVALLLAKGQTLLTLEKPAEALVCFDAAIAVESQNAEALLKKGTALEKLRRMEEALDSYDRAIAADSRLTTAYLYKGGVFNHLQRYEEALKCYEQALQSEQNALAS